MSELPKAYEPKQYEDAIYKRWEESGFFDPDNLKGEPYSIMMPPPNVTGVLHLGHALENSIMDTMARYQRMKGKKVLLLPGTDHAAVATQAKVEKVLMGQGIKNPRVELGREKLLEKIREYSENSKSTILKQIKKMGTSCDWSRLAYTFDEKRSEAVNEVFKKMYEDGLIYRGFRAVNWSVKGQSTCSDDELIRVEKDAKLFTFKYSKDFPFTIATTRPETKLGDTAVAVNAKDKRYKKYIGKEFTVDFLGQKLKLKIISDIGVDMEFGTGALGVTPAHSLVDYEMAIKNDLPIIKIIGEDGKMTGEAGEFVGLSVDEAREKIVSKLKLAGLMEKEEDIKHDVGTSDRFGDVVEVLPMTQWFVAVNKTIPGKNKSLKDLMKEAVSNGLNGDENKKIKITPERFEKSYLNWIDNLRDWCVSRQVWWGHQIPVWYKGEEMHVGTDAPSGDGWKRDPDTLDTWFSSGLWTFSTLGWPEKTKDFKTFHPTNWMQMGHEILFFWMARMILMSSYVLDEVPFKDVYFHGILRDESGKKFSKSAGNGVDPIEVINQYGCDALRWSLLNGITPGNDSRFYEEKIEGARNLVNKLWNISRFILLNIDNPKSDIKKPKTKTLADEWVLWWLNETAFRVEENIKNYNFSSAGEQLRDFTWNILADWYLEIAKIEGEKSEILNYILNTIIKLWHPFTPFVTEQIWSEIYGKEKMLMVEKYPEGTEEPMTGISKMQEVLIPIITGIRTLRAENKIEAVKKLNAIIGAGKYEKLFTENVDIIKTLARLENLEIKKKAEKMVNAVGFVEGGVEVYLDLSGAVDLDKEKERLEKEIALVEPYLIGLQKKLSNQDFVGRAPAAVIEKEKAKLAEAEEKLEKLKNQLKNLL